MVPGAVQAGLQAVHPGLGCFGGKEGQQMSCQPDSRAREEPVAPFQGHRVQGCSLVSPRGEVVQQRAHGDKAIVPNTAGCRPCKDPDWD